MALKKNKKKAKLATATAAKKSTKLKELSIDELSVATGGGGYDAYDPDGY